MPSLFQQPGQEHPYAVLRQQDEFGFLEYDLIARTALFLRS